MTVKKKLQNLTETRGMKRKYDFSNMEVGDKLVFYKVSTASLLNCAKRYARIHNPSWHFRCFNNSTHEFNSTAIVRTV